jgi:nitroreductase
MSSLDSIRTKRAVRQFEDRPLPPETVHLILNAGRRAQSAKNTQPWHFIAVQDRERLLKLSTFGTFAGHLAGAALGVGIITPPPETRFSVMFDAGQAASYMQLAAWDLGVGSCLATIYQPDLARQLLGFPDDLTMLVAISFGYPQDSGLLSAMPKKGGRRSFEESVHWELW